MLAVMVTLAGAGVVIGQRVADAGTVGGAPAIAWAPCPEDGTVECATLRVPVDWGRPGGAAIDLALARRPATDPSARIGSLVVNFGGPDLSSVDDLLAGDYFSDRLTRRFDIVAFDARGVGRSHPVRCSRELVELAPPFLPASQAEFDRLVDYNLRLRKDCRRHTGPLYDHVDTLSVVRDVEAIRAALGERKLSFYGLSYGTLIGQQYAEEYPHRVRALALDSVLDHSLGTGALLETAAVSAQESFDEFVAWCGRDPSCLLQGRDVRALWSDLLARAGRGELPFPPDPSRPLRPEELIGFATTAFLGPDWPVLAEIMLALDAGEAAEASTEDVPAGTDLVEFPERAIRCADFALPVDGYEALAGHLRRTARLAPDMRIPAVELAHVTDCLGAPSSVPNPQHPLRVDAGPKLLLVNALYDPVTGHNWATNVARQLGNRAVLLTYGGWGHGVYGRGPCADDAVDRYLIGLTLPTTTHCPAVEPE
jgi:pimeloyl-ACP methyl ester carboxylesterase